MIDPIIGIRPNKDAWGVCAAHEAQIAKEASKDPNIDTDAAEEEVVSIWYLSSIQSMKATATASSDPIQSPSEIPVVANNQSRFQKIRTWLSGWFGGNKAIESALEINSKDVFTERNTSQGVSSTPKLSSPELLSNERLVKAIADLNKDLLYRLKDTSEFAEEMMKSNSNDMDRLILFHIISKSLDQKKLKEAAGLEAHEHILNLQSVNKDLHKKHYSLLSDIKATAKTNSTLHWIHLGTTAGIVGTLAAGFVTGGTNTVFAIALPALNIIKGGTSSVEGILKYKNDLRTGEITALNHGFKSNRNTINDKLNTTLPFGDEEISHLLKTIRHHLENYGKEARLNPHGS